MDKAYSIGLDFGTLSARAVLVDNENGLEVAESVYDYPHGVIETHLPGTQQKLPANYALQDPQDYIDATEALLADIWRTAGVRPEQVVGIGVDFTACTMVPLGHDMQPLRFDPELAKNPHSWAKLWKHHGAQKEADTINELAVTMHSDLLDRYGGKSSSEWVFPKLLNILNESPDIYDKIGMFIAGGDWIVYLLTGNVRPNNCQAGFKGFWNPDTGYPDKAFLKALHPKFENVVEEKLDRGIFNVGECAGTLQKSLAEKTGLSDKTRVGVANVDAHVAIPAVGISSGKQVLMSMGTSLCHILVSEEDPRIPGISGVVRDTVLPGYFGIEAGQAAVGDIYDWFINKLLPYEYAREAKEKGISPFEILNPKVDALRPGESGLVALDWWNGNRNVLVDSDLTGMIVGMNMTTTAEEIFRAIIEATAFGCKYILDSLAEGGSPVDKVFACGGLARKNATVMQIFSDVLNQEIYVSEVKQAGALGSAIYGAVAAGSENGGYDTILDAEKHMAAKIGKVYKPNADYQEVYAELYSEYKILHDYFGRENNVMKRLLKIRQNALKK